MVNESPVRVAIHSIMIVWLSYFVVFRSAKIDLVENPCVRTEKKYVSFCCASI